MNHDEAARRAQIQLIVRKEIAILQGCGVCGKRVVQDEMPIGSPLLVLGIDGEPKQVICEECCRKMGLSTGA